MNGFPIKESNFPFLNSSGGNSLKVFLMQGYSVGTTNNGMEGGGGEGSLTEGFSATSPAILPAVTLNYIIENLQSQTFSKFMPEFSFLKLQFSHSNPHTSSGSSLMFWR